MIEEEDRKELLEDYQNNPYVRRKIDILIDSILKKPVEEQGPDENHLAVENMQTFNSKKREIRKSQLVKCEELRRQLQQEEQ